MAKLSPRERAFLEEIVLTNWGNHFAASYAFLHAGSAPGSIGKKLIARNNTAENLAFTGWPRARLTRGFRGRLVALMALRIWQEYLAGFEDTLALVSAIEKRGRGDILWTNWSFDPRYAAKLCRELKSPNGSDFRTLVSFPRIEDLAERFPTEAGRWKRYYRWASSKLKEIATAYLQTHAPLAPLERFKSDPQGHHVYILVQVDPAGASHGVRASKDNLVAMALAKLKHGFNAAVSHVRYTSNGGADGIYVLRLPMTNVGVANAIKQTEILGIFNRILAWLTLDMDHAGAL